MPQEVFIKTSELAIGHNDLILKTGSVGSCVVIAIYDEKANIGGLAHAMLPVIRSGDDVLKPSEADFEENNISAKYVTQAVDNLIYGIRQEGGKKENMTAKLVGGASMFKRLSGDKNGIGHQNINKARDYLEKKGVKVESEDTGGSRGKTVEFNLRTGLMEVHASL